MDEYSRCVVVGGGSWGTALAALLAHKGVPTTLWARESEVVSSINEDHENEPFLPGIALPDRLSATTDLDGALAGAEIVVNAVPTQYIRSVFGDKADLLGSTEFIVSVSKGVELGTLLTPSEVFAQVLPGSVSGGLVVLSGPSFAREVAQYMPTAVSIASRVADNAHRARDLFSTDFFRAYSTDDVVGVELGGALKNVIAIAAGIADGLGSGYNTLAALMTRGLAEITRLGVAKGGHPLTFAGLSGMGDLVLTCTGQLSRNRSVGQAIGRGKKLSEVLGEMNMVAEGVKTCESARDLAGRLGVEVPITEQVYQVLYHDKNPALAVRQLMTRDLRDERET